MGEEKHVQRERERALPAPLTQKIYIYVQASLCTGEYKLRLIILNHTCKFICCKGSNQSFNISPFWNF